MYQIGNIYGITAIAVIGGGLFGFDISSMSAMYDSLTLDYYTANKTTAFQPNNTAATSTKDPMVHHSVLRRPAPVPRPMYRVESQLLCLVVPSSAP